MPIGKISDYHIPPFFFWLYSTELKKVEYIWTQIYTAHHTYPYIAPNHVFLTISIPYLLSVTCIQKPINSEAKLYRLLFLKALRWTLTVSSHNYMIL